MTHEPRVRRVCKYRNVVKRAQALLEVLDRERAAISWRAPDRVTVVMIELQRSIDAII